jgi:hypothetical protein
MGGEESANTKLKQLLSARILFLWKLARKVKLLLVDSFPYQLRLLSEKRALIVRILAKNNVSILILPADNRYDFAVFVKAGKSLGIPVCVFPAFVNNALEMAGYVKHDPRYDARKLFNRLTGMFFPKWIFEYDGHRLIHLPWGHVLAREMLGLAPPLPWILHSGYADVISFECEKVRDFCLKAGLPEGQLRVTGAPVHDVMAHRLKNLFAKRDCLYKKLNLREGKPLILCALTPSAHNFPGGAPECDFSTYEDLVEFWIKSLVVNDKFNVIVALHPSVRYDDMLYIEKWGVKISQEPTSELIPLCDLFIASISATIQWAIACGKPVLNYDVYRLRNTIYYSDIEGVITVEEKHEFHEILCRMTSDEDYLKNLESKQQNDSQKWGKLDGKAGDRIIDLLESFS